jgi:tetratricopeptide (TPR) repeat protein
MGFFDKMFGGKEKDAKTAAAEPRPAGFYDALSMQLRGELDAASEAYGRIKEEYPLDNTAPFFAASITAGRGEVAQAAASLRELSGAISSRGDNISRAISTELVERIKEEPALKLPAVAELITAFGDLLKQEGFLREAAVCFEIAAALAPDNAHVLHKLGDTLHDLRVYDYAETVLQEALRQAPNHWGALYSYAVLLQDLGRLPEAVEQYEKAVQLNPGHVNCQNNYGGALLALNRIDEALEHCLTAATLDPAAPQVQLNLGNIYLVKQEYEAARPHFENAIALNPGFAPGYFGLAQLEQFSGDPSGRSRELYLKAIELNPAAAEFQQALGNLLADQEDPEALTHFSAALVLNYGLRNLHRDFGTACLKFGRHEEGMEHLKIALQQNPDDSMAREILAACQLQ